MIRINLLRNSGLSHQGAAGSSGIADTDMKRMAIAKFVTLFLLTAGVYIYEQTSIRELNESLQAVSQKVAVLQAEKAKYGDTTPRVDRYSKEKQRVDAEMEVVRTLGKNRLREVKTLDALQSLMPEKAWLKRVLIEGNLVKLEGLASAEETVTHLIRALESSAFFSRVEPRSITQETVGAMSAIKFELDCRAGKNSE